MKRLRNFTTAQILVSLFAASAPAKTVIVTHPDLEFDENASAGPASVELLRANSSGRNLVLLGERPRLTFNKDGLTFKEVRSLGGEFVWNDVDTEIVMGGGYLTSCFEVTVANIIQFSSKSLNIRISKSATYAHTNVLLVMTGRPPVGQHYTIATLAEFEKQVGPQVFEDVLATFVRELHGRITVPQYVHPGRTNTNTEIVGLMDGRELARIGQGSQVVKIEFVP